MKYQQALKSIQKNGFLLVFPIKNAKHPNSLWNELYPQHEMRWEWDDDGDGRVFDLWRLREQLAASKEVVYGKYFRGRATFFSKTVFKDLLTIKQSASYRPILREARSILELLEADSPLSTKRIKEMAELKGRFFEPSYHQALKELWSALTVVATGEIDDGAFPSLAHAATKSIFEDLWIESESADIAEAWMRLCDIPEFEILEPALLSEPKKELVIRS